MQIKWLFSICYALRDLLPYVQFKKREKHPWSSVTFTLFLNCTYVTRLRKASHMKCSPGLKWVNKKVTLRI